MRSEYSNFASEFTEKPVAAGLAADFGKKEQSGRKSRPLLKELRLRIIFLSAGSLDSH